VAAGPARALRAGPWRPSRRAVVGTLVTGVALAGVIVVPRLLRTPEPTRLTITTTPRGATIEVDGLTVGAAADGSLALDDLEVGHAYPVVARLDGYEPKRAVVQPHAGGNELHLDLQPVATVTLDSQPPDAAIEIDGARVGSTPLTMTSLVPGATVSVVFKRVGYRPVTERVEVPARGKRTRLVKPLEVSDEFVRVRFVSTPPGAEIVASGQGPAVDRTYTPAEMFVEASKVQRFTLTMPKHVPVVIEPFTPARGAGAVEKGGALVEGVTLHIEAPAGKVTVAGAPHCTALAPPVDCILAPGTYVVDYLGPDDARLSRTVVIGAQDAIEKFERPTPQ
ncbi:MAG: PEGA domain-containing protein, partial [Proteobacteria bacterium]|nr:PEGA domain-containing protein [Pseudomonadota bacterium]